MFGGEFRIPVVTEAKDLHTERLGPDGHLATDAAEPDDAHGFSIEFMARNALPVAGANEIRFLNEIAAESEKQREGMLSHGRVVHAGTKSDGDFKIRGRCDIDFIKADAVFCEDFEARQRLLENLASDGIVAAEEGIEIPRQLEHASLGKRSALADDFKSGVCQQIVMRAGGVLKRGGGEEDSHEC